MRPFIAKPFKLFWNEAEGTMHQEVDGLYGPPLSRVRFDVIGKTPAGSIVLEAYLPQRSRLVYYNEYFDARPLKPTQFLRPTMDRSFDRRGSWDHLPVLPSIAPGFHFEATEPGQAWGGYGHPDYLFSPSSPTDGEGYLRNAWFPVPDNRPDASTWLALERDAGRWGEVMRAARVHFARPLSDRSVNRLVNAVGDGDAQALFARLLQAAVGQHTPEPILVYKGKPKSHEQYLRKFGTRGWPVPMRWPRKTQGAGLELMVYSLPNSDHARMVLLSDRETVDPKRPGRAGRAVWSLVAQQCSTWELPPAPPPSVSQAWLDRLAGTCPAADPAFLPR